jgi:hypothetical protein
MRKGTDFKDVARVSKLTSSKSTFKTEPVIGAQRDSEE